MITKQIMEYVCDNKHVPKVGDVIKFKKNKNIKKRFFLVLNIVWTETTKEFIRITLEVIELNARSAIYIRNHIQ